jgi:DnaJ-class molecular chaperone
MGIVRYSRPVPSYGSGISNNTAPTNAPLRQASLAWPGTEETCPKCHGQCHVYYLHAGQPGVEVVGGKRVTCPVCAGEGTVRTPTSQQDNHPAD